MKCSNCGNEMPDSALFCVSCGSRAASPTETCRQCQAPLKPGALFCPNCGIKLQGAPQPVQPAAVPYQPYAQPMQPPVKQRRKGKGLIVAVVILLVLLVAGGGLFALFGNSVKRLVMGPKASYLAIEGKALKQNAADLAADLAKYGNKAAKPAKGGYNVSFQFTDLDPAAMGIDAATAAALRNLTIKSRITYDQGGAQTKIFNKMDLAAADKTLLTMEAYSDQKQFIVGLPGILSKSIVTTNEEISKANDSSASLLALSDLLSADLGVDETKLKATLGKMVDSMLDNIDKTEYKADQPLKVGDVTANYDLYTVTIKKESARKMLLEIFEDLKTDKEFYNLISKFASLSATASGTGTGDAMTYEVYQQSLSDLIADLKADDSSEDFTIVQKIYVGKDNQVFGRDLTIQSASGTNQLHFLYAHPVNGSKEGLAIQFKAEGETSFDFASTFSLKDGKKTGSAMLKSDDAEVLTATFTDLISKTVGTSDRLLGQLNLTFKKAGSTGTAIPAPTALNFTGSEDKTAYVMDIKIPKMVGLKLGYSEIAAADVTFPTYSPNNLVSVSNQEAIQALMTPDVQQKLMTIVQQMGLMPSGG